MREIKISLIDNDKGLLKNFESSIIPKIGEYIEYDNKIYEIYKIIWCLYERDINPYVKLNVRQC